MTIQTPRPAPSSQAVPSEARAPRPHGRTVGIIGFGKLGTVLAHLTHGAGYRVIAAASGDPTDIALIADVLTPGVEIAWVSDVLHTADLIILALPASAVHQLPLRALRGQILVDATNHWPEADGPREDWAPNGEASSEYVQRLVPHSPVVKAFNHLGYHDLAERHRPSGAGQRIAMSIAGDDRGAVEEVAALVDAIGFDPLLVPRLSHSLVLEPGHPAFGAVESAASLRALVDDAVR